MVRQIEGFRAHLQSALPQQHKILSQGQIDLVHAKSFDGVSPQSTLDSAAGKPEGVTIQPPPAWRLRIIQPDGNLRRQIGTGRVVKPETECISGVEYIDRETGPRT